MNNLLSIFPREQCSKKGKSLGKIGVGDDSDTKILPMLFLFCPRSKQNKDWTRNKQRVSESVSVFGSFFFSILEHNWSRLEIEKPSTQRIRVEVAGSDTSTVRKSNWD